MDTDRIIFEIGTGQHGVVGRRQLLDAGVARRALEHRLAQGRLLRVHAGVYRLAGHPTSTPQMLTAACLAAGPGGVVSHRGAAFMHRLAGIEPRPEVSVVERRAPRAPGLLVHRVTHLGPPDMGFSDLVPCTRPARTLVDLAAVVSPAALEVALDDALSRRLVSCAYLRRRLDALGRQGRTGAATLVELLAERTQGRARMGSDFERRLFALLRAGGLPLPQTQYEVELPGGRVAYLDFAYPEVMFGMEADSYRHHSSRTDWGRDRTRNNALIASGWRILPVTWDDIVHHASALLALVGRGLHTNPHQRGQSAHPSSHGGRATMAAG